MNIKIQSHLYYSINVKVKVIDYQVKGIIIVVNKKKKTVFTIRGDDDVGFTKTI